MVLVIGLVMVLVNGKIQCNCEHQKNKINSGEEAGAPLLAMPIFEPRKKRQIYKLIYIFYRSSLSGKLTSVDVFYPDV